MKPIAHIRTDFNEKFGIPRQSGRVPELVGRVVFESEYRHPDALRGMDGFSHLWLIFDFSEAHRDTWSATVRPPRLGGNERVGVFATRSPFRPNPIGLSSVKLVSVENDEKYGTVLVVSGADMLDGTPIYDIKPYLAYTDSHPDATGGFADPVREYALSVEIGEEQLAMVAEDKRDALVTLLAHDPRPSYQSDAEREYGMKFSDVEVFFKVDGQKLRVTAVKRLLT